MDSPRPLPRRYPPRARAILNLGSGVQRQAEIAGNLRTLCARYTGVEVHLARSSRDLYAYARLALSANDELVLAGGGDGTISAIASVLAGSQCVLGVLPLGTFNYFARRLSIPLELEAAVRTCFEGEVRTVPLGEVNGRVFLNNASIGLYPAMLKDREGVYRRFGRSQLAAYVSGLYSLARIRRYHQVEVSAGAERHRCRTPLLFAASNPYQVESFGVAGVGCLAAGHLAFYILPPVGRAGLLRIGGKMLLRDLDPGRDFTLICGDAVRVDTRREFLRVAYDGELDTMRSPLVFRIRPQALAVMTPR